MTKMRKRKTSQRKRKTTSQPPRTSYKYVRPVLRWRHSGIPVL
jgi:hypothetical protein